MSRSLALLVSGLLLVSCKTVSSDKRSHRTPTLPPSGDGTLPADIKDISSSTVITPSGTTQPTTAATMLGKIWLLPQNTADFTTLPSNTVSAVWSNGLDLIYTLHPGVGLGISTDLGVNWKTKSVANGIASSLVNDLYAQDSSVFVATANGISISQDKGETWVQAFPGEAHTRLVGTGGQVYAIGSKFIRATKDLGKSWSQIPMPSGDCVNQLAVYANKLYASQSCETRTLWVTSDAGKTWQMVGGATQPTAITDFVFWKNLLLVGQDRGLVFSTDEGVTWTAVTVLPAKILALEAAGDRVYATMVESGTFDPVPGIFYTTDSLNAASWTRQSNDPMRVKAFGNNTFMIGGDGIQATSGSKQIFIKSPLRRTDGSIRSIVAANSMLYTIGHAGVAYSANGGITWAYSSADEFFKSNEGKLYVTPEIWFVTTFSGLYQSTDLGVTWSPRKDYMINPALPHEPTGIVVDGTRILITDRQGLFASEDSGQTWSLRTRLNGNYDPRGTAVFIKKIGSKVYIGYGVAGGYGVSTGSGVGWINYNTQEDVFDVVESDGRLYTIGMKSLSFSDDLGKTWESSKDPKWALIKNVSCVEAQGKLVFVGTDSGLFISQDKGASFVSYPIGKVTGLALQGTTVYAATSQAVFVYNPTIPVQ